MFIKTTKQTFIMVALNLLTPNRTWSYDFNVKKLEKKSSTVNDTSWNAQEKLLLAALMPFALIPFILMSFALIWFAQVSFRLMSRLKCEFLPFVLLTVNWLTGRTWWCPRWQLDLKNKPFYKVKKYIKS